MFDPKTIAARIMEKRRAAMLATPEPEPIEVLDEEPLEPFEEAVVEDPKSKMKARLNKILRGF